MHPSARTRRLAGSLLAGALLCLPGARLALAQASGPAEAAQAAAALPARQQAIPLIAAAMATSNMPSLQAALNQGLDAGLTVSEAKEILVHLYAYVGFPRSLNALNELMQVLAQRRARGIADAPGREPSHPAPTGDALLAVGAANQTRVAGAPVQGPVFDFAPVINQFLQAHLFGDIFERDNLDWQSRELATVSMLAAMSGVGPQLQSHIGMSMNIGLRPEHLYQLADVLEAHVGVEAAERVRVGIQTQLEVRKE